MKHDRKRKYIGLGDADVYATNHLHALDGLRGIAALCVLFLHASELLNFRYIPLNAALAVDFFFLLSGYVLAFSYDGQLNLGRISTSQFIIRRTVRLYPMLVLGTALGVVVAMLGHTPTSPMLIIGSFLLFPVGFISGIENATAYPYNNPVWSLFFELIINFIYGTRVRQLSIQWLLGIVAASVVGLAITSSIFGPTYYHRIGFETPTLFAAGVFRISCSFWLGVALMRLGLSARTRPLPLWLASVTLAFALVVPISELFYNFIAVLVIFPVLIVSSARTQMSPGSVKACSFLGELSYPIYLVHQPILRIFKNIPDILHIEISVMLLLVAGTLTSVAVAFVALHFIDIPIRQALTKLTRTDSA